MRSSLLIIFLLRFAFEMHAEEGGVKPWETLEGCRLVTAPANEGDSFLVQHQDHKYIFRIYWVDTPKSSDKYIERLREQARYFSIPKERVADSGQLAKRYTRNFLRGEFTVHTKWEDAREDSEKRFFAIIEKDEKYLSHELIARGLARIYGMPTKDKWPGGPTPRAYLSRLKNSERTAQREVDGIWAHATGSIQISGLESLIASSETGGEVVGIEDPGSTSEEAGAKININTATLEGLDTLPGIGPALAQRIIAARPIEFIETLVEIPGISANTLAGFSDRIITEDPPPPEKTVAFYFADLERYLDKEVLVVVESVEALEIEGPKGFKALKLITAYNGEAGGEITTYIPDEFYDSFSQFYKEPGKEFTGLLYQQEDEVVLVYRRQ